MMEEVPTAKKPRRHRPKTTQIRHDLRMILEKAILAPKCHILPLFKRDGATFRANLFSVIRRLALPQEGKFLSLNSFGLKSLNNKTRIFTVCGDVKGAPELLDIEFPAKLRVRVTDTIAYVDNLPLLCTKERLMRRAASFGTVIDVRLPAPRRISQRQMLHGGPSSACHAGYGFVQFTSPHAMKRFCRRYAANSHLRRHGRKSKRHRRARLTNRRPQLSTEQEPMQIDEIAGPSKPDCSFVNVEWSGIESGLESDFETPKKRVRRLTLNMSEQEQMTSTDDTKPKKRIRRKKCTKENSVSLRRLFRMIQVFSYRAYRKLKKQYYQLKQEMRYLQHHGATEPDNPDSD